MRDWHRPGMRRREEGAPRGVAAPTCAEPARPRSGRPREVLRSRARDPSSSRAARHEGQLGPATMTPPLGSPRSRPPLRRRGIPCCASECRDTELAPPASPPAGHDHAAEPIHAGPRMTGGRRRDAPPERRGHHVEPVRHAHPITADGGAVSHRARLRPRWRVPRSPGRRRALRDLATGSVPPSDAHAWRGRDAPHVPGQVSLMSSDGGADDPATWTDLDRPGGAEECRADGAVGTAAYEPCCCPVAPCQRAPLRNVHLVHARPPWARRSRTFRAPIGPAPGPDPAPAPPRPRLGARVSPGAQSSPDPRAPGPRRTTARVQLVPVPARSTCRSRTVRAPPMNQRP